MLAKVAVSLSGRGARDAHIDIDLGFRWLAFEDSAVIDKTSDDGYDNNEGDGPNGVTSGGVLF